MENKSNEEWAELVRAQVAVIDGLTLELATRQPVQQPAAVIKEFAAAKGIAVRDVYKMSPEVIKSFEGCVVLDMSVPVPAAGVQRELMALLSMVENDDVTGLMLAIARLKRLQAAGVQGDTKGGAK